MRSLGLIAFLLSSSAAVAQLSLQDPSMSSYNKCLREAIEDNEVKKAGDQVSYSCFGNTARSWFESLKGDKQVRDKNGLFVARYYGETGYCAHQIEDAVGKAISAYICEIVNNAPN
ncbi:hypothetical protein [Methylocystis sp. B8]|uniref:hypothetical protein n=1 Tax=Methylocystis sp. B8 TaxID=544938 RepID=UPI0010FD8871|nr:hypothetical protein [Methylocystis sp. B8]TLG75085.1 hypothetical protein FEV16_11225 [Methylocystis sp. B8]